MIIITPDDSRQELLKAAAVLRAARKPAALTGAGISVGSGIPDFRSVGGLWSIYTPDEYATLEVFYENPPKAWELYRALGKVLLGKEANGAHVALAELESKGLLSGIITQNVDNLHHQAGSRRVYEIHGDHQHLQCLQCDKLEPVRKEHYHMDTIPRCDQCAFPLKPNVVLFGEAVRGLEEIQNFIADCDLLLVIGTSAQVYPAAGLPMTVKQNGGMIFEFNRDQVLGETDFFFHGDVVEMLPVLSRAVTI